MNERSVGHNLILSAMLRVLPTTIFSLNNINKTANRHLSVCCFSASVSSLFYMLLMYAVVFAIVPIATGGATPGMLLLKFRMVDEDGNANVTNTVRRYISIFATYCTFKVIEVLNSFPLNMESDYYVIAVFTTLITFIVAVVLYVTIVLHIVWVLIGRGKRRYYIDKAARLRGTKK